MTGGAMKTLMSAAAILAALGCGESVGPSEASVVGSYVLVEVNGAPLPVSHVGSPSLTTFQRGTFTLSADATFVDSLFYHSYKTGVVDDDLVRSREGTWTVSGSHGNRRVVLSTHIGPDTMTYAGSSLFGSFIDAALHYDRVE